MTRWTALLCMALTLLAAGCGGGSDTVEVPLTVTLSPTAVSALVGGFVQFAVAVNNTVDSVTFFVNDVQGGNTTVGTISADGLYQAPAVVPANTTITVKAKAADSVKGTRAEATGTVTLDSGVRLSIVPSSYTVGTGEQFQFVPKVRVTGVPPNAVISGVCDSDPLTSDPLCTSVTWSTTTGTIDGNNGAFTAASSAGTATITAKSIYDSTRTATATVNVIAATDPTLSSISNDVGAAGAVLQDIYVSGSNFISTTQVRVNGNVVSDVDPIALSPTSAVLRVRLSDADLAVPGTYAFTVSRQGGTDQACATSCQLTLSARRPALVGTTPDSFNVGTSGTNADIVANGGYFGTAGNPDVAAIFGGQVGSVDSANRLHVASAGSVTPGLVPLRVTSIPSPTLPPAVANVAAQPAYSGTITPSSTMPVGKSPSSIAINTATGIAVIANQASNSVALIDLSGPTLIGYICTATQGATLSVSEPVCPASAPTSVAVDNLRNVALVTNSDVAARNVAVINLATQSVIQLIPAASTSSGPRTPWAVGVNPVSGTAIVAYQSAGFASLINLKPLPAGNATVSGLVAVSTGPTPRIATSPRLDWALVTPGGGGSLGIVDLGRQNTNPISSAARSGNVVTITTGTAHLLRVGDPVLVNGVADNSFNGVFNVTGVSGNTFTYSQTASNGSSVGGTASYALPVATVATSLSVTGVAINDETQKAILVDPTGPQGRIFSLLDQTSTGTVSLALTGNTAGAFNPFTNVAVTVNRVNSNGSLIDPTAPSLLGVDGILAGLNQPIDVAVDPATNQAIVVNSPLATPAVVGSVSFVSLGPTRTPQILQVARQLSATSFAPSEITVCSTLSATVSSVPDPVNCPLANQTLRIVGSGFSGTSVVQLDGVPLATSLVGTSGRVLTATVPLATLTAGPRLYAVQVVNGAAASNAVSFTVTQSVDVSSAGCTAPAPQGVAIDYSSRNQAVVTNPGCNNVAIIKLDGANVGTGTSVAVGTNPQGVAMYVQAGLAVVTNATSNNASIVDVSGNTVVATVNTDPTPLGVAIDPGLGLAVVTASNANVIDTFFVSSSPGTPTVLPVQSRPVAVAVDPVRHVAAVTNTNSNSVSLVDLTQKDATQHIAASGLPSGVAFDPVSSAFLTLSSLNNQLLVLDQISRSTTGLRIGINPTSIAYNYNSSTLVTTNSASETMSVMDFLSGRVRAVFRFKPSGRFAVDIHPFTNLAVIADSVDNRVILRPLPH